MLTNIYKSLTINPRSRSRCRSPPPKQGEIEGGC